MIAVQGDLVSKEGREAQRLPGEGPLIELGQWYWVKRKDEDECISCVTKVGSNFVELRGPHGEYSRIHFDGFDKLCRFEKNPEAVIRGRTEFFKGVIQEKIREINNITARLGVGQNRSLTERKPEEESSRSLSVLSGTDDPKKYKSDLIQAKEKDLPALFKEVEEASENLTTWMKAQTLPMLGMIDGMKDCVEEIEGRIFNVSLYAGLTEEVERIKNGPAAPNEEKLRIMQRMSFMDEECLVNYKHGGMEFNDIHEFDRWVAKPENRNRILPFPRCMVAFRVRRERKDRGPAHDFATAFIQVKLEELDKLTFLYIRNGEQLYRLNCDLEFGELIFPGKDEFDLNEPMMAKMGCGDVREVVTKRHYDDLLREYEEGGKNFAQWKKAHPKEKDRYKNPYHDFEDSFRWRYGDFEPFNPTSVYYDEIKGEIERRVKHYNRIALIVQGLYDRSPVLHPHPPVQLWKPGAFESIVELVYADHGLYHGEAPPDFEAYRKSLNASLKKGSITIGQEDFWEKKEAKKENSRWNSRRTSHLEYYRPYGNPGPGYLAKIEAWTPRTRQATYRWTRERRTSDYLGGKKYGDPVNAIIQVPADELFNVSAYKPGDFKRFYQDPRTRAQYLEWAPILLSAEEFHAGNLKVGKESPE